MKLSAIKRSIDYLPDDPNQAILEVWDETGLDDVLADLEYWFYMAMANPSCLYEDGESRADVVTFYYHLLPFIEAMYFYNQPRDKRRLELYEQYPQETKDFLDSINLPRRLTEEEILHPVPVFEAFYDRIPIEYARAELWYFFEAVESYEGEFRECVGRLNLCNFYMELSTLLEAGYILFKLNHSKPIELNLQR